MTEPTNTFPALGLPAPILKILQRRGFVTPTEIQTRSIPVALTGRDVMGLAQTGTGKTLAFGLPIVSRMSERTGTRALIIAPTRELALQIDETMKPIAAAMGFRTVVLIGGASPRPQTEQLRHRPQIVIATPGRLLDHVNQRHINLNEMNFVVLDEADRMLDMGFSADIERIISQCPKDRQTLLFSATMPKEIANLAGKYLQGPVRVEVASNARTSDLIDQSMYMVDVVNKIEMLKRLIHRTDGSILVFARTKHGARKLARGILATGEKVAEIHADRTLAQRKAALDGFKNGTYRILVATDIASRGIDVKEIRLVINFDVPQAPEDYVHRIGRTGRAGATGEAITLVTPDQMKELLQIERLTKMPIPVRIESDLSVARPSDRPQRPQTRPHYFDSQRKHARPNTGGPGPARPRGPQMMRKG